MAIHSYSTEEQPPRLSPVRGFIIYYNINNGGSKRIDYGYKNTEYTHSTEI